MYMHTHGTTSRIQEFHSKYRMGEELKVLKTWSSPLALRVVWALSLKGVQYESIDEDLTNKSPLLLQHNPVYKKVPVLVHNGKPIVESLMILEYIEETWKQNRSLLPEDPYNRATSRFWAKFGDDKVLPSIWGAFYKEEGKEQEEAFVSAMDNLKFLEEELEGKKFFGGDEIGLVDIALGWLVYLVPVMEEIIGPKVIDEGQFPLLSAWMLEFSNVPAVKDGWPPMTGRSRESVPVERPTFLRKNNRDPLSGGFNNANKINHLVQLGVSVWFQFWI